MKAFKLMPDERLGTKGYVKGEHRWCLPGTTCQRCKTTWAVAGVEYPATSIGGKSATYFKPGVVEWKTFLKLKESIPTDLPLVLPGSHLGPMIGSFQGGSVEFDFNWPRPWTVLVRSTARVTLATVLGKQRLVEPQLNYPKGNREPLFEIQIEPRCELHPKSFVAGSGTPCQNCGRNPQLLTKPILVQESIPKEIHLFRPRNSPTIIIASDAFVAICRDAGMTNIRFEELQLA